MTRIFVHGLESSSNGTKGKYFKQHFPDMIVEDYTGSLSQRMEKLKRDLQSKQNIIMVGSSYGGLMATIFAILYPEKVRKLILLAPALNLPEFEMYREAISGTPTIIFHGSEDEVVPIDEVRAVAKKTFTQLNYYILQDDHSLHRTFATLPWDDLLRG
ncbi:MAG: lysophospholipase [Syntrophales bacterium]|nr:lysophospholipase [Syntrophales bacterium]